MTFSRFGGICPHCRERLNPLRSSEMLSGADALRERLAVLEKMLGQDITMPRVFKLTPTEEQIMQALYRREQISDGGLWETLYGHLPDVDRPGTDIVKVLICKLRKKIGRAPYFMVIETIWGQGLRMTRDTKAQLRVMLEEPDQWDRNGVPAIQPTVGSPRPAAGV